MSQPSHLSYIFVPRANHTEIFINSPPVAAARTGPPLLYVRVAQTHMLHESRLASSKNSPSAGAKLSAIQARADSMDSPPQFVRNALTRPDRATGSSNRPRVSKPPPSTTRATPAMKSTPPDTYDTGAACPYNQARTGAR